MLKDLTTKVVIIFLLIGQVPAHAGFGSAFKKIKREAKKAVKKIVHKPAQIVTEVVVAPTVAVVSVIKDPKETIKNPLETIGHNTSDTYDVSNRIVGDALNLGLDGVGEIGSGLEEAVEPLADHVNIGGGVNVDSNGNTNLTDGEGNIVDVKPVDPSDMSSDSFDWESAIAFSKAHELNEFLKSEEFLNNERIKEYDRGTLKIIADAHIDTLKELSLKTMKAENAKMVSEDIKTLQALLLDFSNGTKIEIEVLQELSALERKYEMLRIPAFNGTIIGAGLVLSGIIIPFTQYIMSYRDTSKALDRIIELQEKILDKKDKNPIKTMKLYNKLGEVGAKVIKHQGSHSIELYKSVYSVIVKSRIPGQGQVSSVDELTDYIMEDEAMDELIVELERIIEEKRK